MSGRDATGDGASPMPRRRQIGLLAVVMGFVVALTVVVSPSGGLLERAFGLQDPTPQFLEIALPSPEAVRTYVAADRLRGLRFEVTNRFRSTKEVSWRVVLASGHGRQRSLASGVARVRAGATLSRSASGRVPCRRRARVMVVATTVGGPVVHASFLVFPHDSDGVTTCTSRPDGGTT